MAAFNRFNSFIYQMGIGDMNLNTDTLKVYLTNTAPVATNTIFGTPAEIAAGNGYVAGGVDSTNTWSQNGAQGQLACVDTSITASGGTIGPFRYAVVYNDTTATKHLVGWVDYGSSITLNDGESLNLDFAATLLVVG